MTKTTERDEYIAFFRQIDIDCYALYAQHITPNEVIVKLKTGYDIVLAQATRDAKKQLGKQIRRAISRMEKK